MFKCWNCGTEHEERASVDASMRVQQAVLERIRKRLIDEMCESPSDNPCDICSGIDLALGIIEDEFRT